MTKEARFCVACGTALAGTEPSSPPISDASESGFIGRQVAGRYRILNKLGEGGMGAVYRAEQISLKRTVALKVLKPELSAEPGLVRRFNAEAELAAKLNHPNTVTLYDFGQDADGSLFIAMEFLEGKSLRELLMVEGPLPPARALAITDQVCASLSDAHGRGIVHRDLKPDNVMLVQIGKRSDVVRVLDFGIAKLRDEQGDITAMPMTRAGDLLGTPQYMAPEQIRGEKVDARTDVYALGAMLYEMVTGRLPFEGPSLMAILSKHLTELPVPPTARRPEIGVPLALSQVIMDALQKDPAARPATMDVFSERLSGLGLHAPSARENPAGSRMPSPVPGYPPAFYSSPPPGVPLLRTPIPGSVQVPFPSSPPPPGPAPSPYPSPVASPYPSPAPAPVGGSPYPSPAPHGGSPYPSPAPAAHGGSPYPSPAPLPPPPGRFPSQGGSLGVDTHPIPRTGSGSRNLVLAIAGLVVVGGAVAVFAVSRSKDSGSGGSSPSVPADPGASPPSGDDSDPDVVEEDDDDDDDTQPAPAPLPPTDFSITPDRPLYDPSTSGQSGQPTMPTPGQSSDDAIWKGGWWKEPSGLFQLEIPAGFQVTVAPGQGAQFAGSCGAVPCTIVGVMFPTPGQSINVDQVKQLIRQIPIGTGAEPRNVHKQKVGGRRCVLMDFDNPDSGFTGEMALCPGPGSVPVIAVQTPPKDFAATKTFRADLFGKKVRF